MLFRLWWGYVEYKIKNTNDKACLYVLFRCWYVFEYGICCVFL
jgi:hypothetical protein